MIVGYHVIFGAYGFWLPNDPRGSWSEFVGSWELYRAGGKATKTTETCSLAAAPHDRTRRLAAKRKLQRPPVSFTVEQIESVARGFDYYVQLSGLRVWACAIMPEHVHLVTARFRLAIEEVVIRLKAAATQRLVDEGLHPFLHLKPPTGPPPKCFAQGEWKVYLDPEDVERSIRYVEENPVKDGLPRQQWPFVTTPDYDVIE